jgi:hypothetical protein
MTTDDKEWTSHGTLNKRPDSYGIYLYTYREKLGERIFNLRQVKRYLIGMRQ